MSTHHNISAAFETLLDHLKAHPFQLPETVLHIEKMAEQFSHAPSFLNQQTIAFPDFVASRFKTGLANDRFFLIPYLVALCQYPRPHPQTDHPHDHHQASSLEASDLSLTPDSAGASASASSTGLQASDLYPLLEALLKAGVNLNATFERDDSALHLAVEANDPSLVDFLMKNGANPTLTNGHMETPVHMAARNNHLDLVRLFFAHGIASDFRADPSDSSMAPLIIAAVSGGHLSMLELLREHHASVNVDPHSNFAVSPLLTAIAAYQLVPSNQMEVISWLLEHGADANEKNIYGKVIFHEAVLRNRMDMTQLLIQHGASVHLQNVVGNTALHIAAPRSLELIPLLLAQGGDLETKNNEGKTPLDVAKGSLFNNKAATIALLEAASLALREKKILSETLRSNTEQAQEQPISFKTPKISSKRPTL